MGRGARSTKYWERGYKEVTTCGSKVDPELRFASEGGGKEVTDRRPFPEGKI